MDRGRAKTDAAHLAHMGSQKRSSAVQRVPDGLNSSVEGKREISGGENELLPAR